MKIEDECRTPSIEELKQTIVDLEILKAQYPEIAALTLDTTLNREEYEIWQEVKTLKAWKALLKEREGNVL